MGANHVKSLYYSAIFYLENSSKLELISVLKKMNIPCLVSPLHDKDVWNEASINKWNDKHKNEDCPYELGELKKAHFHVIFQLPYPKQPKSALLYINSLLPLSYELSYVDSVGWLNLYCRYLCHADDPDKAPYNKMDIVNINHFPEDFSLPSTPRTKRSCRRDLMITLKSNPNISFTRIVQMFVNDDDMMSYIERNAYFVKILISEGQNYAM